MSPKITFDLNPPPGTINLGIGQPSADLLPVSLLQQAAGAFLARVQPEKLNYGDRPGDADFRRSLAEFLSLQYGATVSAKSLFVSAGSSQALDFICTLFTRPGDTVIVEEPSYFLAFRIFRDHGLKIVSVPLDNEGVDLKALEDVLIRTKPRLLYTIPSYQNPSGISTGAARRRRLAELSQAHDFVVVADEVYQMLWYETPPPPALGTLSEVGNILSLGSFSKILAPGLRLGWIQTNGALMERLLDSGVVNSGGSLNHFTSLLVSEVIERGLQAEFLQHLRKSYARRVAVMDAALQQHFSDVARWQKPLGGYFVWLEFDEGIDTTALHAAAEKYRTGFQPGENASSRGGLRNCLRLSFAHYGEDEIRMGIERLARLFKDHARHAG